MLHSRQGLLRGGQGVKLETRLLLAVGAVLLAVFASDATTAYRQARQRALTNIEGQADKVRSVLMAVRRVYQQELLASGLDLDERTLPLLPAHALSRISEDFGSWDRSGLTFNNVSDRPRNPRNRADAVEMQAIAHFRANPAEEKLLLPFRDANGAGFILYARPIRIEEYCLRCHGSRDAAPKLIRDRYADAFGYQLGELRGILSIKVPTAELDEVAFASLPQQLGAHLSGLVLVFLATGLVIRRYVRRPLDRLAESMIAVAEGDYTQRVQGVDGEFARIAAAFNTMARQIPRHQQAARESEERLRLLLEFTGEGIFGVDPDGRCTFINPACLRLLGYERAEEVLGTTIHEVIHARTENGCPLPGSECPILGVLTGGEPAHCTEDVFWCRDGSAIPVEYRAHPILRDGRIIGAVVSFTDISERREASATLRRMIDELARSNAELERFAYVASHDLQEPLRSVASYAQLIERRYRSRLDEDADAFIGFMVEGVRRMQALINGLLAYSRLQTGAAALQPTDAGVALQAALLNLDEAVASAGGQICIGDMPLVQADPTQLVQLFQNLIGNALKFRRPDSPPRVHVAAWRNGPGWEFVVADNGIGIPPEHHQRIFDVFQRLHSQPEYPGTGIGLALCKRIVERHGGQIWVESMPDDGAEFHFILPAVDQS